MKPALSLLLFFPLTGAAIAPQSPWAAWEQGLGRACPSRHVEWISGDGSLDFIAGFDTALSPDHRARLARAADLKRRCAQERNGFSCEMVGTIDAARRLGLLDEMIGFGCRTVQCEEAALCSRMPGKSG